MGKILIGNVLVGKVLAGNTRWAKYLMGNATGRQSTIDLCSTERSEVLLGVPSVMLTLRLSPEAVNKSGCKAGFEVGIGLCSLIPTITKTLR